VVEEAAAVLAGITLDGDLTVVTEVPEVQVELK
jgi:hypothetical protein